MRLLLTCIVLSNTVLASEVRLQPTVADKVMSDLNQIRYEKAYKNLLNKHYQLDYSKIHTEGFCMGNLYTDINLETKDQKHLSFNDDYHHFTLGLERVMADDGYDHYYNVTNPELTKWIHNENVTFSKAIGCSSEHKKVWQDLMRQRSEKTYIYDLGFDKNQKLGFSIYKMDKEGAFIHERYQGLRKVGVSYAPLYSEKEPVKDTTQFSDIKKFFSELIPYPASNHIIEKISFSDFYFQQSITPKFNLASVFNQSDIGNKEKVAGLSYICEPHLCRINANEKRHFYVGQEISVGNYGIYEVDYFTKSKKFLVPLTVSMDGTPYIESISENEFDIYMMENGLFIHHRVTNGNKTSEILADLRRYTIRDIVWNNKGEPIFSAYANSKSYLIKGKKSDDGFEFKLYDLPIIASFSSMQINNETNEAIIRGFSASGTEALYSLNTESMQFKQLLNHDHIEGIVTELHYATSHDGHKVPMLVHRDKKTKLGDAPVLIYAYGGFSIAVSDVINISHMHYNILKRGYVVVVPALRGGPEDGEISRLYGLHSGRENTYKDLDSVAEHAVEQKWAEKGKLLLHGRSNGGLLALRGVLGKPDFYAGVFAGVPVVDMLDFTNMDYNGKGWAYTDYGSPLENKDMFDFWMKNGPLQISETHKMKLPPIFIETALGDANVNPAHSFKMIESLRKNQEGGPFLLWVGDKTRKHSYMNELQNFETQSYMINFFEKALSDGF